MQNEVNMDTLKYNSQHLKAISFALLLDLETIDSNPDSWTKEERIIVEQALEITNSALSHWSSREFSK